MPVDYLDETLSAKDEFEGIIDSIYIKNALEKLTNPDREIAELFYLYECKIRTISEILKTPVGTIKWKLSEIRKKLQNLLK